MTDTQNLYPGAGEILEGKYEIQQVLGTGAMGSVVRAYHQLRKAPVALKFMSPEIMGQRDVVERFLNEGVAASKIDSEHVVKVYDVSKLPSGVPYMVMEFLEGEDLSDLLRREGAPYLHDVSRAVHITLQILRGLQVAHRAKIVHRDMKPANCFVTGKEGDEDFIKIVDFGISKVRQDDDEGVALTHAGAALGTPLYMSLEQARSPKDVDQRTDIYSTAVILYELLSGVTPFVPKSGTLSELFTMLAIEDPKPLTEVRNDLPAGLWEVVKKGLEKDVNLRFETASDFAEALVPYADGRSEYVVSKMLRTTKTGRSVIPPPMTKKSGRLSASGSGTVMMAPTIDDPNLTGGGVPPTLGEGPGGIRHVVGANTAQGTVRDAGGQTIIEDRRSTPLAFAIAVVAVVALAGLAWALGKATATTATPGPEQPVAQPQPVTTTGPTSEPTSTPTAEPTPSTTTSATTTPPPVNPVLPSVKLPAAPKPPTPVTPGPGALKDVTPDR